MSTEVIPVKTLHTTSQNPAKSPYVDLAEDQLLEGKRLLLKQLAYIDDLLTIIQKKKQQQNSGLDSLPDVKDGEFKGARPVHALEIYLRARRGFRIPLSKVVADMVVGGVHPGNPRGKQNDPAALIAHTLKIGIPNRKHLFDFTPKTPGKTGKFDVIPRRTPDAEIMVWLADTADHPKDRKRPKTIRS